MVEMHLNKGKLVSEWFGIRVYEPDRLKGGTVVWHLARLPLAKIENVMTIGGYVGHAFLIRDIEKLAKVYVCNNCRARFTQPCSLQRHADRCDQGEKRIDCPGEKVEAPQTAFEMAFYPKHYASNESLGGLEQQNKRRKFHIDHAMCGHGGERWIEKAPVDGYCPETKTIFQYHGCN